MHMTLAPGTDQMAPTVGSSIPEELAAWFYDPEAPWDKVAQREKERQFHVNVERDGKVCAKVVELIWIANCMRKDCEEWPVTWPRFNTKTMPADHLYTAAFVRSVHILFAHVAKECDALVHEELLHTLVERHLGYEIDPSGGARYDKETVAKMVAKGTYHSRDPAQRSVALSHAKDEAEKAAMAELAQSRRRRGWACEHGERVWGGGGCGCRRCFLSTVKTMLHHRINGVVSDADRVKWDAWMAQIRSRVAIVTIWAIRDSTATDLILKGEFEWKHRAEFFARTFPERSAAKARASSRCLEAEAVAEAALACSLRLEAEAKAEAGRDRGRVEEENLVEEALAESLQTMQLSAAATAAPAPIGMEVDGGILV
jgi:hypothetical protein